MEYEVANHIPQVAVSRLRFTPLDDPDAEPIEWPWNPPRMSSSLEAQRQVRGTAGARWDGQPDASDWTGNRPQRWSIEGTLASIYSDEDTPAALDHARTSRFIAAIRGLMLRPTLLTGEPSHVLVECGEMTPFVASIDSFAVEPRRRSPSGVVLVAQVTMELTEQPERTGSVHPEPLAGGFDSEASFDDFEWD